LDHFSTIAPWSFWIGMIKSPFFAIIIALIGCYEGFQVSGSAESVGRLTTLSVVEAIFLVIVVDAGSPIFSPPLQSGAGRSARASRSSACEASLTGSAPQLSSRGEISTYSA